MKVFRTILLILNILAALGLVATTLAGAIAPSSSILPSVLAYGFLPMLVLNMVLAIVWLCMGRWEFLLSAGTIALRFSYVGLFFQVGGTSEVPPAEDHPQMVTMMTYNVHNFGGNSFESTPKDSNALAFLDLLHEYQPDILCMQEYYPRVMKVNVTDSLTAMGYNHFHGSRGGDNNPNGTVVFSKLPFAYVKRVDQEKVLVELEKEGRRFRLCCVHMDSYAFNLDNRSDIEQMRHGKLDSTSRRTLGKAKETVLRHEEEWSNQLYPLVRDCSVPMILAGDMNDIPSSWLYSQITDLLIDSYCEEGSGFGSTYNGSFPRFRIDMIFHSQDITTLSYHRIHTDISDHYPVLVSLEIKE
jgi:endonuclease/exonuclease/phosphatase family metal-dependent hydrolase